MENGDDWMANDKFQHFLLCFSLTIIFSFLASRSGSSFLRRRSISVGCILSLTAGAAKELADELGLFKSAGASAKDVVADTVGVFFAVLTLSICNSFRFRIRSSPPWEQSQGVEIV